jgi:hypothetical protein
LAGELTTDDLSVFFHAAEGLLGAFEARGTYAPRVQPLYFGGGGNVCADVALRVSGSMAISGTDDRCRDR